MKNNYTEKDLTFVICAYKECEFLEDAIKSLTNQTKKSKILISTSTPNEHIQKLADKYQIEVRVNPCGGQIEDYNFAMEQADTRLIMLMHQDEIIRETFTESILEYINKFKDPIIVFTDYIEMHNNMVDDKPSTMVKIKRLMLLPSKIKWLSSIKFGKRIIQCMGDPITHPTVVCVRDKMPKEIFRDKFKASMDWDLWERLSKEKGAFVYVPKVLLHHRMCDENQTVQLLKTSNIRYENEYEIFCRFWPKWIARLIMKFYSKAQSYY